MVTLQQVDRWARELPEVTVGEHHGHRTWVVGDKGFAWERPFSKADIKRYGATQPPEGPIVAVRMADLAEKEAVLATASAAVFTIPHFNGYPGLLIQLECVAEAELRELLVEAWLACAPPRLADEFLRRRANS